MASISTHLVRGVVAGAVGTTALNAATFLDMALRGRAASSTPEQVVERSAELLGLPLPADDVKRRATESGLGSLLGTMAGISVGVALGALRGLGLPSGRATTAGTAWVMVMVAGNGPMTVLGVTDPRSWTTVDWVADVVPHLCYAVAAAATLDAFDDAA